MRRQWDRRASCDAFRFIESNPALWRGDIDGFFRLGEERTLGLVDPVLQERRLGGDGLAVEIGCGVGRFTRALASRFRGAVGVDVSAEMVEKARALHEQDLYPNVRFVVGDGLTLPVDSGTAGFVFSYEVFQHMPSLAVIETNLRETRRVLSPDGVALLHFPHTRERWLGWPFARLLFDLARAAKHALWKDDPLETDLTYRGAPRLPLSSLVNLCVRSGLRVERTFRDPTHKSHVFVVATAAGPG